MANSLMDFGEIGRLALGVQQLRNQQFQNNLEQQRLDMQQGRADTYADQLKVQQDQLKQTTLMNLHTLYNDPGIAAIPDARGQIAEQMGILAGAPSINFKNAQIGQATLNDWVTGIAHGNPEQFQRGVAGLLSQLPPSEGKKLVDAAAGSREMTLKLQRTQQYLDIHAGEAEQVRNNNAMVNIAKPQYTAMSSLFRQDLAGTDTKQFKVLQDAFEKAPTDKLLSSSNPLVKDKSAFAQIMDGGMATRALKFADAIPKLSDQINQDQQMLTDSEHGIALPADVTPAMLRARIDTNSTLLGATRDFQAWYENPLDKQKHAAAKAAYQTIEAKRLDIDSLEKSTRATSLKMQQDALTFRMSEAERKQSQADAESDAQAQFAALPANQQNPQSAAKIYQSVLNATGHKVSTSDIMKGITNPNKPLVSLDVHTAEKASEAAAKDFIKTASERYQTLQNVPQVLDNIERAKALIPAAKGFMGPGGESLMEAAKFLNNRVGANINVQGVKSAEELRSRMFYGVMDNLKKMDSNPTVQQMQILQKAIGDIGTDPQALPHVLDAYGDNLRQKVQLHNKEVRGAEARGTRFPYDPTIQLPEKQQAGGVVSPNQQQSNTTRGGKAAPAPQSFPTIKGDADFNKLPSGSIFIGPDGKKRRKP